MIHRATFLKDKTLIRALIDLDYLVSVRKPVDGKPCLMHLENSVPVDPSQLIKDLKSFGYDSEKGERNAVIITGRTPKKLKKKPKNEENAD